ncbi:GYF domain-containing protein [Lachnellula subtilissima]|uniref:GYF domain-containing protein n=1 Tax=Lachnellula subtilissima TaxID=602034 RepID=A0A8H8RCN7_9HELO|nr:GYF domain-containing protein [Lachnellula subtilissima]
MPSHMPSSFASAAAGQASGRDSRTARGDGRGSGDWPRRDSRATNGFVPLNSRRTSSTPFSSAQDASHPHTDSETSAPQSMSNSMYDQLTESRYSRSQLLDVFKAQQESGTANRDVSHLYANDWNPGHSNGANGRTAWGRSSESRETYGPEICWEAGGNIQPIALEEMDDTERKVCYNTGDLWVPTNRLKLFSTDVNSPLKPPPQNANKDSNAQGGTNGRKASVSHGQGTNSFGLTSPVSSRPTTRRQMTSDSIAGLSSPAGTGRFSREETSFFNRKFNENKDAPDDPAEDRKSNLPFGGLMRANTAGSILSNGPASPWGPASTSAAMSPMGNFGSFAMGGSSPNPPTPIEKRPGFESIEDISSKAADRAWRPRQRTDTDPFGDEPPAGSAALGGGQDTSPPISQRRAPGLDTPVRGASGEFGMSDLASIRDSHRGLSHQTPHHHDENETLSPETNPYRSPPDERHDDGNYEGDAGPPSRVQGLGGIPEHGANLFGNMPRGFSSAPFEGSDRSQTSSVGATKAFPAIGGLSSLSGLGGMGGWPTSANPIGTPDRENRPVFPGPFGNSLFGPMGELQSPSLNGLGGVFGSGPSGISSGTNTIGRGSKLGSLFPAAMQAQMQANDSEIPAEGSDGRQSGGFGAIGRNTFTSRETDSPIRTGRAFEDMFQSPDTSRMQGPWSSSDIAQGQTVTSLGQGVSAQSNYQQSQASSDSASNQLPTAQQKMMVMPDRMRWVYLDPQGHVQGPFSGLEMHDWYKANFFTPDLSVKKLEETEFEPLGQLIRRIGNSREPFLVPQIGIPHGPASTQAGGPFTPAAVVPGAAPQPGSVQPPFAGAFPSFGTTLTAEQQNNLERRKQEEQYLMARQREFLAQQQVTMKQLQMGGLPSSLHHHSSAHSLQSQPSFGSITSPIGMPQQPTMSGSSGFFDGARQAPAPGPSGLQQDFFREEELANLNIQERQQLFGAPGSQQSSHAQQIAAIFGQPQAQRENSGTEETNTSDPLGFKARLLQFEQLREQHDQEEAAAATESSAHVLNEPIGPPRQVSRHEYDEEPERLQPEVLSLTQQVQKAASSKQSPVSAIQPESPWAKVNPSLPMPFPPPQSSTPLPAPTAQRGRSNLPEALNVGTRSRSETPDMASSTPSLAPWAKEQVEAPRGPSLKEIQEAEAKKAAKDEEIAAAGRRIAHEQEMRLLTSQPLAPAPGLPTTSTWGSTASPATPTNASSVWAKPAISTITAPSKSANSKKTLADIQREEELRKQKLAAAAAASQPASVSGGKRYADLASKSTASVPTVGSAWSTVGAGGKVKIPTGPAAAAPQAVRSVTSASIATPPSVRTTKPVPAIRSVIASGSASTTSAHEEFNKWAKATLAKGLNSGINVDDFVRMLSDFPPEASIITDSIYSNSQLMDGRHFAEEYLRRKKLADKGVVEPAFGAGEKSGGGWSEVAKKGPPKEETASQAFKVVPTKKKGKK